MAYPRVRAKKIALVLLGALAAAAFLMAAVKVLSADEIPGCAHNRQVLRQAVDRFPSRQGRWPTDFAELRAADEAAKAVGGYLSASGTILDFGAEFDRGYYNVIYRPGSHIISAGCTR